MVALSLRTVSFLALFTGIVLLVLLPISTRQHDVKLTTTVDSAATVAASAASAGHNCTTQVTAAAADRTVVDRTRPSAYFALAANRPRWFECFRLAFALRQFGSRHKFVCGTLEPPEALSKEENAAAAGLNMRFVHWSKFWQPSTRWGGWDGVRANWRVSWNKLNAFGMDEYEALVHLDTDVVLTRAADELFAVVNDDYPFAQTYGQDACGHLPYGLNGGVFVVRPSKSLVDRLMRFIDQPCEKRQNPHCDWLFSGSEQTVLALFMGELRNVADEYWDGRRMPALSHIYNIWGKACECPHYGWLEKVGAIYHLISPKPWDTADFGCAENLHRLYMDAAEGVRAYLRNEHPVAASTLPLQT